MGSRHIGQNATAKIPDSTGSHSSWIYQDWHLPDIHSSGLRSNIRSNGDMGVADEIKGFTCKIKEDTYKFFADGLTISFASLLAQTENWILVHGAALLISGRLLLLALDGYKRLRDVKKPEWDNIVKPVLKREAVQERGKTLSKKIKTILIQLFKL